MDLRYLLDMLPCTSHPKHDPHVREVQVLEAHPRRHVDTPKQCLICSLASILRVEMLYMHALSTQNTDVDIRYA